MKESTRPLPAPQSVGDRMADGIAAFGGSWTFILLFLAALAAWTRGNTELLGSRRAAFDPYPYVFLNLILSMLTALQAPVSMMSQNRAAEHDRQNTASDSRVNVRAEHEVRHPHKKPDTLRDAQRAELVQMQHQQITLLTGLAARYQSDRSSDGVSSPARDAKRSDAGRV